jgi:signal transduction histidine kinase
VVVKGVTWLPLTQFAVWLIMTWLTRRIRSLSDAAADLAAGDLSRRVEALSADDIGLLGRNFNAMAARLEELIEELRNKELFQRQLIANISHDLRTPLASLQGYIETLSLRGAGMDPDEYQRYLGIVGVNLQHLDRLVDHLLQLSRLDAGQAPFQFEEFPLPELAEGVLARCASPADAKNKPRLAATIGPRWPWNSSARKNAIGNRLGWKNGTSGSSWRSVWPSWNLV